MYSNETNLRSGENFSKTPPSENGGVSINTPAETDSSQFEHLYYDGVTQQFLTPAPIKILDQTNDSVSPQTAAQPKNNKETRENKKAKKKRKRRKKRKKKQIITKSPIILTPTTTWT